MNLILLLTAAFLATSAGSNINRHNLLPSNIGNQLRNDALTRTKHRRYFVTISQRPEQLVVLKPGSVIELTCEGIGAPAPHIRWFKNNHPVYEHDQESNEITYTSSSSLGRVTSTLLIARSRNKDEYTCVVSAKSNSARATTVVLTEEDGSSDQPERTRLFPREPHILTSYKIFVDTIGNNVSLPCKARGHPKPNVVWRDNNGNLIKMDERVKVLRSGRLSFSPLRWADLGEYTCEATNSFGSQKATTFLYPAKAS